MDINELVGIPWVKGGYTIEGADCWGLVLIACSRLRIPINIYKGSKASGVELSDIIIKESLSDRWEQIKKPEPISICTMTSNSGKPEHIGLCFDGKNVLHSLGSNGVGSSIITSIKALDRFYHKLEFYKYVGNHNHIT